MPPSAIRSEHGEIGSVYLTRAEIAARVAELVAIPNFGRKSIEEVRSSLAAHGLLLKGEDAG